MRERSTALAAFFNKRAEGKKWRKFRSDSRGWSSSAFGPTSRPYEGDFLTILETEYGLSSFDELACAISETKDRRAQVLDLMAPLDSFVNKINKISHAVGIAVTLGNEGDVPYEKQGESAQVYGDLLQGSTWAAINRAMSEIGIEGFDLAVCRPVGGFDFDMAESGLINVLQIPLKKAYRLLHQDGVMMATLPYVPGSYQSKITQWVAFLSSQQLDVKKYHGTVMIKRTSTSPSHLPNFKGVDCGF